ncbi:MAG TPA: MBL fold metallo-hydrolase [Xanthobacteraceae bacterium]|nr:MBL fold metallo-hydrolase [Xanthobacteraceae bacterium]
MSDDVPFNRDFSLAPGTVDEVMPGLRRVLCGNPSPFTFTGTVTYIVGRGKVGIIDPGPDDDSHVAAVLKAVRNETVTHILVTHTHRDHSPAAAKIKAATGAPLYGEGPHRPSRPLHLGEAKRLDAGGDQDFCPDHAVADGDVIAGDGWRLEAVATPGHTRNHMAYGLGGTDILFSGDHVMGWSTTIVAPPDGSMRDYMNSLAKLQARPEQVYLPGHGPAIRDASAYVAHLVRHREAREAAILAALAKGEADIPTLVKTIYVGLDPRLTGAAGLSVLAHLEDLVARGRAETEGEPSLSGRYRAAAGSGG